MKPTGLRRGWLVACVAGTATTVLAVARRQGSRRRSADAALLPVRMGVSAPGRPFAPDPVFEGSTAQEQVSAERTETAETADSRLARQVRSAVLEDPRFSGYGIQVTGHEATVVLHGTVVSSTVMREVVQAVMDVEGVREVRNLITAPGVPAP